MIKKLLTICALATLVGTSNAQNLSLVADQGYMLDKSVLDSRKSLTTVSNSAAEKTSIIAIGDTLWYFFNKHYYRNIPSLSLQFSTVKSPYQAATTPLTHFGSRFTNSGSLNVIGLEGLMSRHATSTSASVTVRMILCNIVAGQPSLPGIDSITAVLTGTAATFVGGNFTAPKNVTGDFAVIYRCASPVTTDTIRAWMNNAKTATATAASSEKYGEGFGHIRAVGNFITMTGVFGAGTDFEFVVAPRVAFQASAGAGVPTASVLCTNVPYTFNNTSDAWLGNRQYNMNQFYRHWLPFSNTVTINADSVYTWNFGDATGNFYTTTGMPSINHAYTAAGTFNGSLIARYMKMSDTGVKLADAANFAKTVSTCAGIQSISGLEAINVYPNPSTGLVNISNLPYESTIDVVNMLGQLVYSSKANQGNYTADLSTLPNGSYFVKISVPNEKTKIVKLILN